MPANSPYSPTMVNKKSSLDIMSSIAENLSVIAKDLVEYVQIKTGENISPTVDSGSESLSPTPEIEFVGPKKKPAKGRLGFLAKFVGLFTRKNLLSLVGLLALVPITIIALFSVGIVKAFKKLVSSIGGIVESIGKGMVIVGEFFSNLFAKGGELISDLYAKTKDFMAPVVKKFKGFVSSITGFIVDKFNVVKTFLTGFSLGPIEGETGTPDSNTVDTENVPAHLTSSQSDDMDIAMASDQPVMKGDAEDIARTRREIRARDKKLNSKSPSLSKFKESSSTISTPTPSSGGMDDVKAMIKQHEGVRYKPYTVGDPPLWHIGYGHLIGNGKTLPKDFPSSFSKKEVDALFDKDFAKHKKIAVETPGYGQANRTGKAAFIDLAFNMGKWWPGFPKASKALKEGNFSLAANELKDSTYYSQVGKRAKKIVGMVSEAGPDESAGSNQGTILASNSNSNSIEKRGMSMNNQPVVVNTPTVNNNSIVKNDIVVASKQKNTSDLVNRIS